MARLPRSIVPLHPYHVIIRGNNRRRIFSYPSNYRQFIYFVEQAHAKYPCPIHSITLMSNHVHLLVSPPSLDILSKFIKAFAQCYAQYRNFCFDSSGKLFEERFKSIPIKDMRQFAITQVYCELNPVRAGLVDEPLDYPWSSFAWHTNHPEQCRIPITLWSPSPWYLSLAETAKQRADLYEKFIIKIRKQEPKNYEQLQKIERSSYRNHIRQVQRPNRKRAT